MDNYLTKLSKIEIRLTNIGHKFDKMGRGYHGHNMDKSWT